MNRLNESTTDNPKREKTTQQKEESSNKKQKTAKINLNSLMEKNEKNPKQRAILHQERYTTSIAIVEEMEKELCLSIRGRSKKLPKKFEQA